MKNIIKDKDNLFVENDLFSDVLGDVRVDKHPLKILIMKNKRTC